MTYNLISVDSSLHRIITEIKLGLKKCPKHKQVLLFYFVCYSSIHWKSNKQSKKAERLLPTNIKQELIRAQVYDRPHAVLTRCVRISQVQNTGSFHFAPIEHKQRPTAYSRGAAIINCEVYSSVLWPVAEVTFDV